mmetsp:Transcript_106594/g.308437  ORF Transcript_106594/g.308437 Transcript_106594/m.308437 type:complete len:234 (-) Transcript_106594:597-1298(-)
MFVAAQVVEHALHSRHIHGGQADAALQAQRVLGDTDVIGQVPQVILKRLLRGLRSQLFLCTIDGVWRRQLLRVLLRIDVCLDVVERQHLVARLALELVNLQSIDAIPLEDALGHPLLGDLRPRFFCKTEPFLHLLLVLGALHVPLNNHRHCHRPLLAEGAVQAVVASRDALLLPAGLKLEHSVVDGIEALGFGNQRLRHRLHFIVQNEAEMRFLGSEADLVLCELVRRPVGPL